MLGASGAVGRVHPELPAHAEVRQQGVAVGERQPQVLPAPGGLGERAAGQRGGEVVGAGEVAAYGPGVQDLDPLDAGAGHGVGQPTPDGLDLRKLRQGPGPRRAGRPRALGGVLDGLALLEGGEREGGRVLLGLLLVAPGAGTVVEGVDRDGREERLRVVGARLEHVVDGHAQPGERRDLLQARLPVQARTAGRDVGDEAVEEVVHEAPGGVDAVLQEHGPDQRLHRVGEDRGLVPPAGGLLAPPEVDERPEVEAARDLREGARVDDRSPQLGELTLRQVGEGREEVLGDHQSEDGVTEELEAFVRGQPTLLVRVRAVRERPFEQHGLDDEPELVQQRAGGQLHHDRRRRQDSRTWRRKARVP